MRALHHLRPIVQGALRRRLAMALVVVEIALGTALIVHGLHIVQTLRAFLLQTADIERPLLDVTVYGAPAGFDARLTEDTAALRAIDGVVGATWVDTPPLGLAEQLPDAIGEATYTHSPWVLGGGPGLAHALGSPVIAGRDFTAGDLAGGDETAALVTRTLAAALFPGQDAVGKPLQSRRFGTARIVGVVEDVTLHYPGASAPANTVLYAVRPRPANRARYLVRTSPARHAAVQADIVARFAAAGRTARAEDAQRLHVLNDHANRRGLDIVYGTIVLIVLVVLSGSAALTSYLVVERRRDIGLRRALGATRADILTFFLIENALVTTAGVVLGCGMALALVPILGAAQPGFYLNGWIFAGTIVTLYAINLVATWIPARRATRLSPTVATHGV